MNDNEELERLRARVGELESELDATRAQTQPLPVQARPRGRWRSITAATLIVLSCVLAPLSVTAVWASNQVSDTDRYVQTVAPLADDPAVQSAIAAQVTQQVFKYVDIDTLTTDTLNAISQQNLPPRAAAGLQALKVPIVNGLENFTRTQVEKIVASPQFATVWEQANRAAHTQLVNLLSGKQSGAVTAQNGQVTLNLAPIIAQVKDRLVAQGYTIANNIPSVDKSFVLVSSDAVTKAQAGYRLLNALGNWLPVIALALLALGVYIARGHRRALMLGSLGIVGGMLALGVALAVARPLYLDAVPTDVLPRQAAADIFDTLVRFLRNGLRATAVLALIVALGAFFTGPSVTAARTRSNLAKGIGSLRGSAESKGLRTGPVGVWTFEHKRVLRIVVVIAGGLVLTFWSHPTVPVVVVTALVVLLAIGLVELLGAPPQERPAVPAGEGPVGPEGQLPRQREPQGAPTASSTATPTGSAGADASSLSEKETTPHA